jgi:hypothetical protein
MDPYIVKHLHDRTWQTALHADQKKRDRQLLRYARFNKISNPKDSYKRAKSMYKKGKINSKLLRAHPEYESYVFKKWMRPQDY